MYYCEKLFEVMIKKGCSGESEETRNHGINQRKAHIRAL